MKVPHPFVSLLFGLFLVCFSNAQDEKADPATLDPSDIYFQSWIALRDADEYQQKEEYQKAFESATRSKRLADTLALYHPEWKVHLVARKQKESSSKLISIGKLLPKDAASDLPLYQSTQPSAAKPVAPGLTAAEILQATKIQRELAETKKALARSENQRNADVARLQKRLTELTAERDRLANSTLQQEVRELKNRIDLVEDEKRILARKLNEARTELTAANRRATELDEKEKKARLVANQLNAMLEKERKAANGVIQGIRDQKDAQSKALAETKQLLFIEQQRTHRLESLLADTRGEVESLTNERNHLLKERDHLAELLKLNQGDRIQRMLEENLTLARNLREAEEIAKNLSDSEDEGAKELLEAKRDIALAKSKIIEQRSENDAQMQRSRELERKLTEAYDELKARESLADLDSDLAEENRVLRKVADRFLTTQKRRREQAALLLKTAKENKQDSNLAQAVEQLVGEEIALTIDEKMMIQSDNSVTGSLVRDDRTRSTPEQVQLANAELRRYTNVVDGLIENAYRRGKIEVALDLSEELIESNPGYYPAMLDQGVILLKMGHPRRAIESFDNATILRGGGGLPYANFMKGVAYHSLGEIENAQLEYETTVKLDPSNADAFNRLGILHVNAGRLGEARENFEIAYRLDDTHLEPLFNLSTLHSEMGEVPAALNYYRKYRNAGGHPQPDLESLLAQAKKDEDELKKKNEAAAPTSTPVIAPPRP